MHSEPNYGILWFYFKNTINDSALDIWNNATKLMVEEIKDLRMVYKSKMKAPEEISSFPSDYWTGYTVLNKLYQKGLVNSDLTYEEKWRNIYGFEQIVG